MVWLESEAVRQSRWPKKAHVELVVVAGARSKHRITRDLHFKSKLTR
jgi:hypothetical protein